MKAACAKAPEPTTEQLELALRQLWRPGYPRTLADALEHPTFGHCVRGLARNLGRAAPPAAPVHRLPTHPVPATPQQPPAQARQRRPGVPSDRSLAAGGSQAELGRWTRSRDPGWIDRKRAAANDFDD